MKRHFYTLGALVTVGALVTAGIIAVAGSAGAKPPTTITAPDSQTISLKGTGAQFSASGWTNVFKVPDEQWLSDAVDPSVWHLVYSGKDAGQVTNARVTFTNGVVWTWDPAMGFSTNGGGKNPGWVIVAPAGWQIDLSAGKSFLTTLDMANPQFNISGYHQGTPNPASGALAVKATIVAEHTLHTVQPVWQKTLQEVRQRTVQPYVHPVYQKKVSSFTDTLVSRLTYSNDTATAVPTNGGLVRDSTNASTNGFTFVEVTAAATDFGIADSSYNASGNKTPADYNKPIGYSYTAQIVGNKVVIRFDDRLIAASVHAEVVAAASPAGAAQQFSGNAGHHDTIANGGELDVPLPPASGGHYYLFVHFAGISWFTTGTYELVRWDADHTEVALDKVLSTNLVKDEWLRDDTTDSTVDEPYVGATMKVSGPGGYSYAGDVTDLTGLAAGDYEVSLIGDDGVSVLATMTVSVENGKTAEADFGTVTVTGADETVTLDKTYADPIRLDPTYEDPITLDAIPYVDDSGAYLNAVYLN